MTAVEMTARRVLAETIEDLGLVEGDVIIVSSNNAQVLNCLGLTRSFDKSVRSMNGTSPVQLTRKGFDCGQTHLN